MVAPQVEDKVLLSVDFGFIFFIQSNFDLLIYRSYVLGLGIVLSLVKFKTGFAEYRF